MKKIVMLMMVMLLAMCMVMPAFAADGDDVRTGTASGGSTTSAVTEGTTGHSPINDAVNGVMNDFVPTVTTNDIVNRLETKGNDVVLMLQTVGKYVCIGAFIICCLLTIVGIIGNPRLLWAGVIGMIVAGLAYAGIVCGREVVNWIANWAIS